MSLGFGEIVIICIILIVVVGPERLPAVMKNVGKTMRTVRQASRDLRTTIGIDEMMREDVMRPPPPRPMKPPPASVSRDAQPSNVPAPPAAVPPAEPVPPPAAAVPPAAISDASAGASPNASSSPTEVTSEAKKPGPDAAAANDGKV